MVETICALSTPEGRAALGLIRISGPRSLEAIEAITGKKFENRIPTLAILKDKENSPIDESVVTYFKAPQTYTGEDMVEISAHGNPAIVAEILRSFVSRETFRMAEPGEFTRRALANGKISIDKVEALDSLIHAETFKGAQKALQSKLNGLSSQIQKVLSLISELQIELQAQLDFSENEVGAFDRDTFLKRVREVLAVLKSWSLAFKNYEALFNRRVVVLAGSPNVGKSSLFNKILGIEKAIVHETPGTTRDYLEHSLEVDGCPILIVDTAGIREGADQIEALGILRSAQAMERADIICWISDQDEEPPAELASKFKDKAWLKIASKADLKTNLKPKEGWLSVSTFSQEGLSEFKARILPQFSDEGAGLITSKRQGDKLEVAMEALSGVEELLSKGEYLDFIAVKVKEASTALGEIVEEIPPEETLKSIFSRFCIGK